MDDDFHTQLWQILSGNILLFLCCIFYLAWWIVAFHPEHSIKGVRSGWLLLPAAAFGIWAIVQIVKGCLTGDVTEQLFPKYAVVIGGIAIYFVLLITTAILLKRQVTSELILIIGWTVLMFLEFNALYSFGVYTHRTASVLCVVMAAVAVLCLVCYLQYYTLDAKSSYWDGMIPLLLAAVMMATLSIPLIRRCGLLI